MILENGQIRINVLPEIGATLGEFSYCHEGTFTNIFRKADPANPTLKNISFFVVGPWITRIPERKFSWDGKEVVLEHPGDEINAIHGIFRQFPWKVESQTDDKATLSLEFKNGDSGYTFVGDFRAEITYQIVASTLKVGINFKNTSSVKIPCALGSHPMILKREENANVKFDAKKWFPVDPKLLVPKGIVEDIPGELNAPNGRELPPNWDHCLADWSEDAVISWPKEGLELVLSKEDEYSNYLQCWSGEGREVFALEQLTAPANSFNLLAQGLNQNGVNILNPGEEVKLVHTYAVKSL